jgi:hypothetical protein
MKSALPYTASSKNRSAREISRRDPGAPSCELVDRLSCIAFNWSIDYLRGETLWKITHGKAP